MDQKSQKKTIKPLPLFKNRNLVRDNHYIPQMYLRGWSNDGKKLWSYKKLSFNENDPAWQFRSIKSTGVMRNLYTRMSDTIEQDDLENLLSVRFESPASDALNKAKEGQRLSPDDWTAIIRFICAQYVRTPAYYLISLKNMAASAKEAITEMGPILLKKTIPHTKQRTASGSPAEELIPLSLTLTDFDEEHSGLKNRDYHWEKHMVPCYMAPFRR